MNGVQGPSRLLNHSRFPAFRKYRRSARWPRAALVFAHASRSLWAFGPSAHRAHASFRRTCGSLWAFGPSAHRAHASLRACRGLGQTPGRSIVAEGAGRAHRSFRSPPSGALRCAQQPTGLTLPSGAPSPVPQHKKRALRVPEGHKKRASLNPSPNISANGAAILHPEGPRRFYSKNIIIGKTRVSCSLRSLTTLDGLCRRKRRRPPASSCIKPRFSRPFGRSQRSTGFAAGNAGVLLRLPASCRVSCSLRSLATLTAFAAAEVFGALPQTPARA